MAAGEGDLRTCIAALMVQVARVDDPLDTAERTVIERLLADRFSLSARELVAAAERAVDQSTQIFRFIDSVVRRVHVADRVRIIEMLRRSPMRTAPLIPTRTSSCGGSPERIKP
jgi:uncharacterized tellurite resistance protein B-like protein